MRKRQELTDPMSCMSRARNDEMTFVLLGRDASAPAAIYAWVADRLTRGKNVITDPQIQEAIDCAKQMEMDRLSWPAPEKKPPASVTIDE